MLSAASRAARRSALTINAPAMTRAFASLDWTALSQRIKSQPTKDALTMLQKTSDTAHNQLDGVPEKPEAIDWAYWDKAIQTPGLVETFKKSYEAMKLPTIPDTSGKVDELLASVLADAKKGGAESEARIQELKALQAELAAERAAVADVTVESTMKEHPKLAKEVEDEIDNRQWS